MRSPKVTLPWRTPVNTHADVDANGDAGYAPAITRAIPGKKTEQSQRGESW
ncbi:hypothetical protein ABIB50_005191 [Mucilaginibacter sp. UYCu711]